MIYYFISTTILLKLYYIFIKLKIYYLSDYIENKLINFNVYVYKDKKKINTIYLSEWFFDDYNDYYKYLYDDRKYYVQYKLFPPINFTPKALKASANGKKEKVFKNDGYKCLCCGSKEDLTVDHIIPISKGGNSSYYNLQTLCNKCNSLKDNKIITIEELKILYSQKY